jgi:hypothetical protein
LKEARAERRVGSEITPLLPLPDIFVGWIRGVRSNQPVNKPPQGTVPIRAYGTYCEDINHNTVWGVAPRGISIVNNGNEGRDAVVASMVP